jgi:hypothetical protein
VTGRILNVTRLPSQRVYICKDENTIDLREFLGQYYTPVAALAREGLVKHNDSFGFAMATPMDTDTYYDVVKLWDDPEQFTWFVGGWGPNKDRYIANAVRKMRALLREKADTLDLRFNNPGSFRDKIESVVNGTYPWGDFPWGGACFVTMGDLVLAGAISCLSEIQDDFVTRLILSAIGERIVKGDDLLTA